MRNFDAKTMLRMVTGAIETENLKNIDGEKHTCTAYGFTTVETNNGNKPVLYMELDGKAYATASEPFQKTFRVIANYITDNACDILVIKRMNKDGTREYLVCDIA